LVDRLYRSRLERYARRADVVHSHFADLGWSHHRWIRRLRKPHVISFYGYDYAFRPPGQGDEAAALRALDAAADLFLCEGMFGRQRLLNWGVPAEKVHVQHLGVDTSQIPIHPRRKLAGELNLVQAAGFVEKKGHQYTIAAFVEALADCPNMTLTLVGPDPYHLREKLAQVPASARYRVRFPDPIPSSRIHEFFKDFHVFIHPSCHTAGGDSEGGAPVALLDAQATGMPIISTRHCDIPEEVLDQKTGLLADEKDVIELARHIRRFYAMGQAEFDTFACAAVEHVRSEYDVRQTAAHLAGEYRELLAKQKAESSSQ
jgi:colanic acid/amylovoran biosynthesis glycosyltransferase